MRRAVCLLVTLVSLHAAQPACSSPPLVPESKARVICPRDASALEILAAREVRRYVYLRTGRLLPIDRADAVDSDPRAAFAVARKDRALALSVASDIEARSALENLEPQQFRLRTFKDKGRSVLLICGGDDIATLYAAYRLAEQFGVRFYLHGDVIPEERVALKMPFLDERHAPTYQLRGIQPFHDFPEGPDWWNADDYQAVLAQLAKLRMNFFGLHTYPENAPSAEPTVWIGFAADAAADGTVGFSYPASYQNTLRGNWGYSSRKTSDFHGGAANLFETDAYGGDVMAGLCPSPDRSEDCNTVFERTGKMLNRAFTFARALGIKTCVGTETPLTIPKRLRERIEAAGRNPSDPTVLRDIYEGMFSRIGASHPLDYYWFWTPEGWTWEGTTDEQMKRTTDDLLTAIAAARRINAPFQLTTCGWVLGPQQDRTMFDKLLPKDVAISCINREVGKTPVDAGFALVRGRGKWAIPWMEDDPALTAPQLWVGRMRRDAADARRYGCDGLMGIHWRTRAIAPNIAALAQAAWDQSQWNPTPFESPPPPPRAEGPLGGATADYPNSPIADTYDDRLYQTVRYNLSAYDFKLPDGAYTVTLKFCEPHYSAPGKRVFGVKLQNRLVIDRLDVFARVGQNRALDFRFEQVAVTNGWLEIGFVPVVEFPCIAAIAIEGPNATCRVNCGGPAYNDYSVDPPPRQAPVSAFASSDDFYLDWATCEFGPDAGPFAADILARIDCKLPRPSDWVNGPGGIRPDPRPWAQVAPEYSFVAELEALAPLVVGKGNRDRFDYWIETFRYHRAMAKLNCVWAQFNQAMDRARGAIAPSAKQDLAQAHALPLRRQLVNCVNEVYRHMLATVSTPGEMGTVANWDQHLLPDLLDKPAAELAAMLGADLPVDAYPTKTYQGSTRVIVPTLRSSLAAGEDLRLKIVALAAGPPSEVWLWWRPLGTGSFAPVPVRHIARSVYEARLTASQIAARDFEYYVEVVPAERIRIRFPSTAPALNQSVVLMGASLPVH